MKVPFQRGVCPRFQSLVSITFYCKCCPDRCTQTELARNALMGSRFFGTSGVTPWHVLQARRWVSPRTTRSCRRAFASSTPVAATSPVDINEVRAVVIGGGITGVSVLYHLELAGIHTALFEKSELFSGATWHSGGLLAPWPQRGNLQRWHEDTAHLTFRDLRLADAAEVKLKVADGSEEENGAVPEEENGAASSTPTPAPPQSAEACGHLRILPAARTDEAHYQVGLAHVQNFLRTRDDREKGGKSSLKGTSGFLPPEILYARHPDALSEGEPAIKLGRDEAAANVEQQQMLVEEAGKREEQIHNPYEPIDRDDPALLSDVHPWIKADGANDAVGLFSEHAGRVDGTALGRALLSRVSELQGDSPRVYEHSTVVETQHRRSDGRWEVVVASQVGGIRRESVVVCEHVVNCAGLWAREVGALAGIDVPSLVLQHQYIQIESGKKAVPASEALADENTGMKKKKSTADAGGRPSEDRAAGRFRRSSSVSTSLVPNAEDLVGVEALEEVSEPSARDQKQFKKRRTDGKEGTKPGAHEIQGEDLTSSETSAETATDEPGSVQPAATPPIVDDVAGSYSVWRRDRAFLLAPYEKDFVVAASTVAMPYYLYDPSIERLFPHIESASRRFPQLGKTAIRAVVNGPICLAPDALPLVGPASVGASAAGVSAPGNYWLATAGGSSSVGRCAGVGSYLAHYIQHGEPPYELDEVDPRRFLPGMTLDQVQDSLQAFYSSTPGTGGGAPATAGALTAPEFEPSSRCRLYHNAAAQKTHEELLELLKSRGALLDRSGQAAESFDGKSAESLLARLSPFRQRGSNVETESVRKALAIAYTPRATYEVTGPDSSVLLERLLATRRTGPRSGFEALENSFQRGFFLTSRGRVCGEAFVLRVADDHFYLSAPLQREGFDLPSLHRHARDENLAVAISTSAPTAVFLLTGKTCREVLAGTVHEKFGDDAWPEMEWRALSLPGHRSSSSNPAAAVATAAVGVRVLHLDAPVGEPAFELHVPAASAASLYQVLVAACGPHGLQEVGMRAFDELRLECGVPGFAAEYVKDVSALEAGVLSEADVLEDEDDVLGGRNIKEGGTTRCRRSYIGREALQQEAAAGSEKRLQQVLLEVVGQSAEQPHCVGGEPLWWDDEVVGFTTSGAFSSFAEKSIAMGYVEAQYLRKTTGAAVITAQSRESDATKQRRKSSAREDGSVASRSTEATVRDLQVPQLTVGLLDARISVLLRDEPFVQHWRTRSEEEKPRDSEKPEGVKNDP